MKEKDSKGTPKEGKALTCTKRVHGRRDQGAPQDARHQPGGAAFIGFSASIVQDWKQGRTERSGPACRIMGETGCNPQEWARKIQGLGDVTVGSKV